MADNIYTDVKVELLADGSFDLSIVNNKLEMDTGFNTIIYLSLLTDKRATKEEVKNYLSRGGWLGNLYMLSVYNTEIGSKLWLLGQARLTQSTLNAAEDYCRECLEWMITDKLVDAIDTSTDFYDNGILINITLTVDNFTSEKNYSFWLSTG